MHTKIHRNTGLFMSNETSTDFTAIMTDSEDELDDEIFQNDEEFLLKPPSTLNNNNRKFSNISRRRSSVFSKISINNNPINSQNLEFIQDYSSDLSNRTINDFEEINILGIGSYGRVYLVEDIYTKKLYAKKTIKKAKISIDTKLYKTHKNEREILSKMNHPSIVKLFYAFHDFEDINFILEYIPGGEIFYHLSQSNRFNENDTAFYLAEISQAIYHLHSQAGIVYRDLKPENVMLNAQGHIVLTDFGLSSMDEICKSILGTPEFTAPEVLKGEEYSFPADWWSLGIMMFDMLTGKSPFTGNNKTTIFKKIIEKKLEIPKYLSLDAQDLLRKLINKNPQKRMNIDKDFTILEKHRFFRKIDWKNLRNLKPPIIPDTTDLRKATNFDHNYIREIMKKEDKNPQDNQDTQPNTTTEFDNDLFQGFSFVASKPFLEMHM
ncbi:RAC-alpha serine/threonine-protein kinase [Wickerhamomyces ciferrii]|uniref:RAC-alpha serine/threonine-protein kinase n=1 Tax=Wickerhamomyces ciferrii (strain ATCC 14091 / BCRC 22168 / CBS 111 / JCM 3599 / NBRC 0793 / NRRL Y-1031 F-60-10) TaxID=1206466 RepID=K0KPG5_WICCF|nr:RAC-alpha serine/threonine-protein kinase [Wickerhamomyces ciferrii]CCH44866.1 RAC-alpha serine/threonine-protein kinase [Wickerhamomyces ciferrii]